MNKYLSFTLGTAVAAVVVVAGCGGDTVNVDGLFAVDASVAMDATVTDSGAPDHVAPTPDAEADAASPCTGSLASCNGACVDTMGDGANCGGCGNTCPTGMVCSTGSCVSSCSGASTACGTSCVDTTADPNNCGGCGNACATGLLCSNGQCAATCAAGLSTCASTVGGGGGGGTSAGDAGDAGVTTLRCVDTLSDDANCGGCGVKCAAGQVCSNGACAVSCQAGLVQCGTTCVDPTSDPTHCGATAGCGLADAGGAAGVSCPAGQVCGQGVCSTSCQAGFVNCNGSCVDPKTNGAFCGASGNCTNVGMGNKQGSICVSGTICGGNGVCQPNCQADEIQCGTTCINPLTNPSFCGAKGDCASDGNANDSAGTTCANGQLCSSGKCAATCSAGQVTCNNLCVDPQTDPIHCGATTDCAGAHAGTPCVGGQVCTHGGCATECQPDEILCGTTCVNSLTNPAFCGAKGTCVNDGNPADSKGTACAAGLVCSAGMCGLVCAPGFINCNGTCINPLTDTTYCGAMGACNAATGGNTKGITCGTGTVCSAGSCGTNCGAGLSICTSACVDEAHDPAHCGSCTACAAETNVASDVCRNKVCAVGTCAAHTADCNATFTDGCEVNTNGDANNCGACGHVCSGATPYCLSGACSPNPPIALVGAPGSASWSIDIQTYLVGTNRFSSVTIIDAHATTPTVAQLAAYYSVLVFNDGPNFQNSAQLGNNLADYYDAGGRVVLAAFANASLPLAGRFATGNYGLINPAGQDAPTDTLGTIAEPASPLVAGVTSLGCNACYRSSGGVQNGGVVSAFWGNGAPLIVHGTIKGRERADLNLYPPPSASRPDFLTGSYAAIVANALLY